MTQLQNYNYYYKTKIGNASDYAFSTKHQGERMPGPSWRNCDYKEETVESVFTPTKNMRKPRKNDDTRQSKLKEKRRLIFNLQ
jgi:hypothetical protein